MIAPSVEGPEVNVTADEPDADSAAAAVPLTVNVTVAEPVADTTSSSCDGPTLQVTVVEPTMLRPCARLSGETVNCARDETNADSAPGDCGSSHADGWRWPYGMPPRLFDRPSPAVMLRCSVPPQNARCIANAPPRNRSGSEASVEKFCFSATDQPQPSSTWP